jgi:hypothetical protein
MSDEQPEQRPRSSLAVWLALALLVLPLAYVLSPGPIFWLLAYGYVDQAFVDWLLGPLQKLYDNYPPVTAFYDWYFTLLGLRE